MVRLARLLLAGGRRGAGPEPGPSPAKKRGEKAAAEGLPPSARENAAPGPGPAEPCPAAPRGAAPPRLPAPGHRRRARAQPAAGDRLQQGEGAPGSPARLPAGGPARREHVQEAPLASPPPGSPPPTRPGHRGQEWARRPGKGLALGCSREAGARGRLREGAPGSAFSHGPLPGPGASSPRGSRPAEAAPARPAIESGEPNRCRRYPTVLNQRGAPC